MVTERYSGVSNTVLEDVGDNSRPTPAAGCSNCSAEQLTFAIHWNRWMYEYPLCDAALPTEIELFGVPLDPRSVRTERISRYS
jgi:hypothetical protein